MPSNEYAGGPSSPLSWRSSSWMSRLRGVANGSSSGQIRRTISMPGSWPVDCTTTSRPFGARARASGASTVRTFGSASVRERYGWAASTRSYSNSCGGADVARDDVVQRERTVARYSTSTDGVAYTGLPLFGARRLPSGLEDVLEARDLLVVVERRSRPRAGRPTTASSPGWPVIAGTGSAPRRRTCW